LTIDKNLVNIKSRFYVIELWLRIRIFYCPIKDPQLRGADSIAITMIDNMEYIHTMYIITTRKY
jgi:hypothetical protein